MMPVLSTADQAVTAATELLGLALLAGTLAAVVGLGYRWFTREEVPVGLALLAGLAGVAAYLNTTSVLGQVIDGNMDSVQMALFNVGAFLLGGIGAFAGRRWGDSFGRDVIHGAEREAVDEEVSRLVKTVGRVTTVTMPQDIDDVVGYDLVSERTREAIAGTQFVFPRNLTVAELDRRVRSRLKTDFGVGTVDLELSDDGTVDYLAVGSRAAGIGPTLPPATNAVALRADPAFAASTGDVVQVWEADTGQRVLTGELRGVAGDVVTVAINSADTPKVDPTRKYRLVTLPVEDRPAREFASLLRSADETYTSVTVEAGSPLHGMPVGALDLTVVGVKPEAGEPVALPPVKYVLSPGELLYVIGRPETLRKLERAGDALDPSLAKAGSASPLGPQQDSTDAPVSEPPDETTPSGMPAEGGKQPTETQTAPSESPDSGSTEQPTTVADGTESPTTAAVDAGIETPESGQRTQSEAESAASGKADTASFDELKAEYEEGEEWDEDDQDGEDSSDEPIENIVESSASKSSDVQAGSSEGTSFDELKDEFESGDADWDGPDESESDDDVDEEVAFGTDSDPADGDDLVSLDEADISFDEEPDEAATDPERGDGVESETASADAFDTSQDEEFDDFDDDLADGFGDGLDDGTDDDLSSMDGEDDISSLTLDDDDGDDLFEEDPFEDDELFEDEAVDESAGEEESETEDPSDADDEEEEADEDDSDDGGGGGGSTFAQLKEEFESGDADWEDDVSDSPGGDMRLDE
jgi:hypothetical protein